MIYAFVTPLMAVWVAACSHLLLRCIPKWGHLDLKGMSVYPPLKFWINVSTIFLAPYCRFGWSFQEPPFCLTFEHFTGETLRHHLANHHPPLLCWFYTGRPQLLPPNSPPVYLLLPHIKRMCTSLRDVESLTLYCHHLSKISVSNMAQVLFHAKTSIGVCRGNGNTCRIPSGIRWLRHMKELKLRKRRLNLHKADLLQC